MTWSRLFFRVSHLPYVIEKSPPPKPPPPPPKKKRKKKTCSARLALQETCFNILADSYASLT